jgi:phage tail-like protein
VPEQTLLRNFRFRVKLLRSPNAEAGSNRGPAPIPSGTPLGDAAFQECTGLELAMDVQEHLEGGRNDGVIKRVGRAKLQELVLKRGMLFGGTRGPVDSQLWVWIQDVLAGTRPVRRYDGIVEVMSVGETVVARWAFDRGLPAKLVGPSLNGKTGDVAIEELHIAHEGLRLVVR